MSRTGQHLVRQLRVAGTREGDRVTTLELFFDLVYAFAFTQVTELMVDGSAPGSVVDGLIVLSLLWFSWCSFSWLANQARANEGVVQGAFIGAMMAIFIASLVIPDAFRDVRGALDGAAVVAACYGVVRVMHAGVYLVAAREDRGLRRQVLLTVIASLIPTVALLAVGAAAGQPAQRWIWLTAVLYDFASVFVTANISQGWQIPSAAHFVERHGLIVILALGESIIAIATGLGRAHLTGRIAVGAVLSILIAVGLYVAYFSRMSERLEQALDAAKERGRAKLGTDVFTYLHFPIIVGVIVTAAGIEQAMGHLDGHRLGVFGGWALGGGTALFLAGSVASVMRSGGGLSLPRTAATVLLLGAAPALAEASPLVAVGTVAAALLVLAVVDSVGARADDPCPPT